MPRRIRSAISRILRDHPAPSPATDVHFHADANGRPYVCDYARCTSPGLDVEAR
jgi:hypothetical protein